MRGWLEHLRNRLHGPPARPGRPEAGGGRYRLRGTLRQSGVSGDFVAMVPLYAQFGKGQLALLGRLPFRGEMEQALDVTVALPKRPKRVLLNALHDVLAR